MAIHAESASSSLDKASGKVLAPEAMSAVAKEQTSASSEPGRHKEKGAKKRHGRLRQIARCAYYNILSVLPTYPSPVVIPIFVSDCQNL